MMEPQESIRRGREDGFWVFWGEGLARDRGEDPVSTNVTYGESQTTEL